jgi:beta-glucuronidase
MKNSTLIKLWFTCFLVLGTLQIFSQNELLHNVYNRETTSLNGNWQFIIDPYENGYYNYRYEPFDQQESPSKNAFFRHAKPKNPSDLIEYDFDQMDSLRVPGDWNNQKPELLYYEGTVWYKKSFDYKKSTSKNRVFVYFEAANYKTEVYLNGHKLGSHIGGFTPFNFEITDVLQEKDNFLVVKVDNKRLKEGVPTLNTDWWNYGGLTRGVKLVETPQTFIQDFFIQPDPEDSHILKGYVLLNGEDKGKEKILIHIPGLNLDKVIKSNDAGYVTFQILTMGIRQWSPENPFLYDVVLETKEDQLVDQIGFRSIRTSGSQILLNDKPIYLRGISIHEERPLQGGRGLSKRDAEHLLNWAQELGCNFVRLAHYPHNEHMVRLADQKGMLVWEENPVYWTIDWKNEATYQNAENQLSELISRDKNRASVIIWSMANETPTSDVRNRFLSRLAQFTKTKDPTRLISAALEQKNVDGDPFVRTIDDAFAETVDVLSFNQYIGWYDGLPEKCDSISWKIKHNKPVLISEFGAGAKFGMHGAKTDRWTEEYQEDLYIRTLNMLDKIEQVRGMSPWILVDFKSPRRVLPKIQDGWNRKGLLSNEGKRKKAFYVLQNYYLLKKKP